MKRYWEVQWESYGTHGAKSTGTVGCYDSYEEAVAQSKRSELEFAQVSDMLADTSFFVVKVTVDAHGNREEENDDLGTSP